MTQFLNAHTYFSTLFIWLLLYLLGLTLFFRQRRSILLSSIAALPQALFAIDLVPKAWVPDRIFKAVTGIEDFIFCFLAGGLVWISVLWMIGKNVPLKFELKPLFARIILSLVFGFVAFTLLYFIGIDGYLNPFIIMVLWCGSVLIYRFSYWKIVLTGITSFFIIWFIVMLIILAIWPDIPSLWSWEKLWGISFFHFPIEELIWALLYGGSWSLSVAFFLDIRVEGKKEKFDQESSLQIAK